MSFAEDFKEARKKAGHTQKSISEFMSIPRRTVEDWERGINSPPHYVQKLLIEKLESLCK